jgi:ElaB/YqjD/DUF883 family membrane-anchored ribosome-binding protein
MSNTNFDTSRGSQSGQPRAKTGLDDKGSSRAGMRTPPDRDGNSSAWNGAPNLGDHVKTLLADQVGSGADVMAHFATATRKAADELDTGSPQAARFVRGVADRLEDYAGTLRNQSVDDLARAASDYTRRQPALVFGMAALAGFLVVRTFKNASARQQQGMRQGHMGQGHMDQGHAGARKGQSNVY